MHSDVPRNASSDSEDTKQRTNPSSGDGSQVIRMDDVEALNIDLKEGGEATTETSSEESHRDNDVQPRSICRIAVKAYNDYDFLFWLLLSVPLAKAWPELGAVYLQPDITASWIAVMYIFLISGLSLKTQEVTAAFKQIRFHVFVQIFNFLFMSSIVFGFTRVLISTGMLMAALADGMAICACLPIAINMVIILAKTSHGDDGTAVLNSALGNMLGVFVSPLLIMSYLGVYGEVNMINVFYKLAIRVLVPLVIGQVLQRFSSSVSAFVDMYSYQLSKSQMFALLYVVYTVFCDSFLNQSNVAIEYFLLVLFLQFILLLIFSAIAWYSLRFLWRDQPALRVTGLFACTHKTISLGVPVINAMYQGSPNLALYILPALMWYPLQLVIGSILAPRLRAFVKRENERLAAAGCIVATNSGAGFDCDRDHVLDCSLSYHGDERKHASMSQEHSGSCACPQV